MRTAVTVALLALTLGAGACAGPKEEAFTRVDQDAIRQVTTDFAEAFNARDIDRILSLYADNSVFMPPNAPMLRGREPLKSFYSEMFGTRSGSDLKLEPQDVSGHGPLGYQSGAYSMNVSGGRDRGKYLFILRNLAGNWRFEYTSWSSDLPAR